MRFLYSTFFILLILLSACTTMNDKFTCKTPDGVMCRSLDDVNGMVDRGELGSVPNKVTQNNISFTPGFSHMPRVGEPLRYGETVMRVWIAPYEDKQGNYHEDSVFYMVIKPGHWTGSTLREIVDLG